MTRLPFIFVSLVVCFWCTYDTKNRGLNEVLVQKPYVSIKSFLASLNFFLESTSFYTYNASSKLERHEATLFSGFFLSCRVKVSTYMMKRHKRETGFYVNLKFVLKKDSSIILQRTNNNGGFVGWKCFLLRPLLFKRQYIARLEVMNLDYLTVKGGLNKSSVLFWTKALYYIVI